MKWELLRIEERLDGTVFLEWETVADDGLPLVEGTVFAPEGLGLEAEVGAFIQDRQSARERINDTKKRVAKKPRIKRKNTQLDLDKLKRRVDRNA